MDRPLGHRLGSGKILLDAAVLAVGLALILAVNFRAIVGGPRPWVLVINSTAADIRIRLWDGGQTYTAPCGTKQGFPQDAEAPQPPSPPWHMVVSDQQGRVLIDRTLDDNSAWQLVSVGPDGATAVAIPARTISGPPVKCQTTASPGP